MSNQDNQGEESFDKEPFNLGDLDDLGVVGEGEVVGQEEVVGQGEVVGQVEVVGQGDKQPDNKRKRSEWSEVFLAKQNKPTPLYVEQRQRSLERQAEGLSLNNLRLMNEDIGDFTKEQVDDIGSSKRQKRGGGSRKKRSKSKTRSRKQKRSRNQSKKRRRSSRR